MELKNDNVTLVNLIRLQQAFGSGSMKAVKTYNILNQKNLLTRPFEKDNLYGAVKSKAADKILSIDVESIYKIIDDCVKNNIRKLQ